LLDILREQLQRCGPEKLTPSCPACHCESSVTDLGVLFGTVILVVFLLGYLLGVTQASRTSPTDSRSKRVKEADSPAGGLSRSALQALRDGRN